MPSQSDLLFADVVARNRRLLTVTLEDGRKRAEAITPCKRKGVTASIFRMEPPYLRLFGNFTNGSPWCNGVKGGCGCVHSEVKAAIRIAEMHDYFPWGVLVATSYSPCTGCANALLLTKKIRIAVWDILTEHDPRGAEILRGAGVYTEEL